jgi:hypothetical protein
MLYGLRPSDIRERPDPGICAEFYEEDEGNAPRYFSMSNFTKKESAPTGVDPTIHRQ